MEGHKSHLAALSHGQDSTGCSFASFATRSLSVARAAGGAFLRSISSIMFCGYGGVCVCVRERERES